MKIKSIRTACIILCTTIIVACSIGVNLVTYTGMKGTIKKTNSDYKDAVISGYKEQIKDEVGAMLTVVNMVYEKSQSGEMSEKDAKKEAMEILRNARYGEDGEGYFWIDGTDYTLLMHPILSEQEGTNRYDLTDQNGVKIIQNIMKSAEAGGGYNEFYFTKADGKTVAPKIAYSEEFEPWGWVITTSKKRSGNILWNLFSPVPVSMAAVMATKNKWEFSDMVKFAVDFDGPIAIRYPRGEAYDGLAKMRAPIVLGKSETLYDEEEICLIAFGSMVKTAVKVREMLKERGYHCSLINARFAKPLDYEMLTRTAKEHRLLVTLEENVKSGGFGEQVMDYLEECSLDVRLLNIAISDEYVEHGNVNILYQEVGIDAESVVKRIIAEYVGLK